jgi:hypothetical protein
VYIIFPMLPKERLKVRLDFGQHATKKDAATLRRAVEEFRPHILVVEDALIPEDERKGIIRENNSKIQAARKSDTAKQRLLEDVRRNAFLTQIRDFVVEQMDLVISTPGLFTYVAENSTRAESAERSIELAFMGAPPMSIHLITQGKIDEAISLTDEEFHDRTDFFVFERNRRVTEGLVRLLDEAEELFPGIEQNPVINVLLRYGTYHMGMYDQIQELGFDVVTNPLPPLSLEGELIKSLNGNHTRLLTHHERIRMLFVASVQLVLGESAIFMDDGEYDRQIRTAFEKVGSEAGFVQFLRLLQPGSHDDYLAKIGALL